LPTTDFDILSAAEPAPVQLALTREQRAAITGVIKGFAEVPAPMSSAHVRELIDFENKHHAALQNDRKWYFDNATGVEGKQFARDMFVLHSYAARAWEQLVARRGEWSHGDSEPLLQQVVTFALYHHGAAIKWCLLRLEPVTPTVWPKLHELYRLAETNGFATQPVTLYAGDSPQSPLARYLLALLLDLLNTGSLTMAQIEIGEGWLAEWAEEYLFDEAYRPRAHALYVDLDAMSGLKLMTGNAPQPSHRFLRVEGLKNQIESARSELREGRRYAGRGLPDLFPIEEHVALLSTVERLYLTLLQASASRLEERTSITDREAEVRLGFADAQRAISGADDPAPGADPRWTRWKLHDMSSRGIGLMVPRVTGERVGIGQLLAMRPDGFPHWLVGVIVRKMTQRTRGETLLGVELLSYRPLAVGLQRYAHARDAAPDTTSAPLAALFLPGRDEDGKGDVLAVPAGDFGLKNVLSLTADGVQFRVRINRVLRKGGDWIALRYEVIGRK